MSTTEIQDISAKPAQPLKLIDALKVLERATGSEAKPLDVFLVCGFTPLHLKTFLAANLQQRCTDRQVQVHTGLYGDFFGNLQRAAASAAGAMVVPLEWADLDPRLGIRAITNPTPLDDIRDSVCRQIDRLQDMLARDFSNTTIGLSLPTIPYRCASAQPASQTQALDAALSKRLAEFAEWAAGQNNIRLLNPQRLDERSPSNARWNPSSELSTGFPYQLTHASILGNLLSQLIHARVPKKGLITDLDDTLWRGIVGETGVDGISWSLEQHSHVHALYQQQLRALADAGTLIAVASKNDASLVEQAFQRSDLLVSTNQIFPFEVSWGSKSAAVRRILEAWNIGPDSVVFVDDSPMEIAEVQAAFPDMECLRFCKDDPQGVIALLDQLRDLFGKRFVSDEDSLRLNSLRVQNSIDKEFLEDANAAITFSTLKDPPDPRVLELINKTNQFNLNGRRYTDTEWIAYLANPASHLLVASYEDKYGRLGKIAVAAAHAQGSDIIIDTWVMSCRAFSRRIEHQCLLQMFNRFGVDQLTLDFQKTPRNSPLQEFLGSLGYEPNGPVIALRSEFERRCPTLFHTTKDANHE